MSLDGKAIAEVNSNTGTTYLYTDALGKRFNLDEYANDNPYNYPDSDGRAPFAVPASSSSPTCGQRTTQHGPPRMRDVCPPHRKLPRMTYEQTKVWH